MTKSKSTAKVGAIQQRILLIRGEKVIVAADLAESTKCAEAPARGTIPVALRDPCNVSQAVKNCQDNRNIDYGKGDIEYYTRCKMMSLQSG